MPQVRSHPAALPVQVVNGFIIVGLALIMMMENPFYTYKRCMLRLYRLLRKTDRFCSAAFAPLEDRIARRWRRATDLFQSGIQSELKRSFGQLTQFGSLFTPDSLRPAVMVPEVRHALSRIRD